MRQHRGKSRVHNLLLQELPADEYARLSSNLVPIHIPRGRVIYEAGARADFVYFPVSGVVSMLSTTQTGAMVEVGMVGKEGTTWIPVVHRLQALPYKLLIQISVDALKCGVDVVQEEFLRGGKFHSLLTSHTHSLFAQISQSAVCNRFHSTESRFCRWLLAMHDRIESDTLLLTHEILSNMLGAERAHTSRTAKALQNKGLITYEPGSVTILNRQRLETASCECYRVVKQQTAFCLAA
jgi:CRP-like cAMP-binding protein